MKARLGVNIDHVATLRQLRGTPYPDIYDAANMCEIAGAHQITVHLREDRRHIQDADVTLLRKKLRIPLNLEMAATDEMTRIARKLRPDWVCLVPEKRKEVTTEGGLAMEKGRVRIKRTTEALKKAKIKVSHFIEPSEKAVQLSHECGADAVELHTGRYCLAAQGAFGKTSEKKAQFELERIRKASEVAIDLGLKAHAGHGFDYKNIAPVVLLNLIEEYNIGHSIVCRAVYVGLEQAVREMLSAITSP